MAIDLEGDPSDGVGALSMDDETTLLRAVKAALDRADAIIAAALVGTHEALP